MTQGYKFRIEKENAGYVFRLYPNNNNKQQIASSMIYDSKANCMNALEQFKIFVKTNNIEAFLKIEKIGHKFVPSIVDNGKTLFHRMDLPYDNDKDQCNKWIERIKNNIDAPLKG